MEGYIKLYRRFFDSRIWRKTIDRALSECEAWLYLNEKARFDASPTTSRIGSYEVTLGKGQYSASIRFLAEEWKRPVRWVRTFLNKLVREKLITMDNSQGVTVITIVDCHEKGSIEAPDYSRSDTASDTASDTSSDTASDTPTDILNKLSDSKLMELLTQVVTQAVTQQVTQGVTQQVTQEGENSPKKRHTTCTNIKKEEERRRKKEKKIKKHTLSSVQRKNPTANPRPTRVS